MSKRTAISAPLNKCFIAICGKLGEFGYTQGSLKQLIMDLGGSVTQSVTKTTTHVVCSKNSYEKNSVKVAAGKAKNLPLVSPDWIFNAQKEDKTINQHIYIWGSNKPTNSEIYSKKRPFMVSKTDEDKGPEVTRYKTTKGAARKAKATNPRLVTTNVKEEKEVAEGQFMKHMDAAIPVDEHCSTNYTSVHIDSSSRLIYDASLNLTNASSNNNKFYRIQVSLSFSPSKDQIVI